MSYLLEYYLLTSFAGSAQIISYHQSNSDNQLTIGGSLILIIDAKMQLESIYGGAQLVDGFGHLIAIRLAPQISSFEDYNLPDDLALFIL